MSRVLYKGLVHEVCVDRRDTWCGVCYADWYTELWKIATTDSVTCLACLATGARPKRLKTEVVGQYLSKNNQGLLGIRT